MTVSDEPSPTPAPVSAPVPARGTGRATPRPALPRGARALLAGPGLLEQAAKFVAVGVTSTLAYLLLYWLLRDALGPQPANAVSLVLTTVVNTAANRRWTFGVRGATHATRHQAQAFVTLGLALTLSSLSLAGLRTLAPDAPDLVELAVLACASGIGGVLRFVLLRTWVFGVHRR